MKTVQEWSLEFDLLYNNLASDKAPGVEEYEKSVYLTRAQEAVVLGLYEGKLGDAFESTEATSKYLTPLVKQATLKNEEVVGEDLKIAGENSHIYKMPEDLLFRTYEVCLLNVSYACQNMPAVVVPVTQDEYWSTARDPFKGPSEKRVLRLSLANVPEGSSEGSSELTELGFKKVDYSELVSKYPINSYMVRYIRRPKPIILEDLTDSGYSINGQTEVSLCELDEGIHQTILVEAVKLAKSVWTA